MKILAAALLILALSGCDATGDQSTDKPEGDGARNYTQTFTVTTKSGRTIECVALTKYSDGSGGGGISCDWAGK